MYIYNLIKKIRTEINNGKKHFLTIREHRKLVRQGCFRVGLYVQGITHDLSKYSPEEFSAGVKYYQGFRSPNNAQREDIGYSAAWLHHKGRNKHHYEYWLDYSSRVETGFIPAKMPNRYLVEMFMDRIAASKTYNQGTYKNDYPLQYYKKGKGMEMIEKSTADELEHLLTILAEEGEDAAVKYIRKNLLRNRPGTYISWFLETATKQIRNSRKVNIKKIEKRNLSRKGKRYIDL